MLLPRAVRIRDTLAPTARSGSGMHMRHPQGPIETAAPSPSVENKLMARMKRDDDEDAFAALVDLCWNRVIAYIRKLLRLSEEEHKDVAWGVFSTVWAQRKCYCGNKDFFPWLYKIAQNMCIDMTCPHFMCQFE